MGGEDEELPILITQNQLDRRTAPAAPCGRRRTSQRLDEGLKVLLAIEDDFCLARFFAKSIRNFRRSGTF
jgi:hypothetical protein